MLGRFGSRIFSESNVVLRQGMKGTEVEKTCESDLNHFHNLRWRRIPAQDRQAISLGVPEQVWMVDGGNVIMETIRMPLIAVICLLSLWGG